MGLFTGLAGGGRPDLKPTDNGPDCLHRVVTVVCAFFFSTTASAKLSLNGTVPSWGEPSDLGQAQSKQKVFLDVKICRILFLR